MLKDRKAARAYARAFYPGIEKEFEKQISLLENTAAAIRGSEELADFLNHPSFEPSQKSAALFSIVAPWRSEENERLLSALLEHKSVALLSDIIGELKEEHRRKEGIAFALVTSACPLSDADKKAVSGRLARFSGRKVEIEFAVDPDRIAGLSIRLDDRVIDNTVASELKDVKTFLLNSI